MPLREIFCKPRYERYLANVVATRLWDVCILRDETAHSAVYSDRAFRKMASKLPKKPQLVIVTGVPTETDLKKSSAMNSGMRIHPCEAG